jgi:hypothetical protein
MPPSPGNSNGENHTCRLSPLTFTVFLHLYPLLPFHFIAFPTKSHWQWSQNEDVISTVAELGSEPPGNGII